MGNVHGVLPPSLFNSIMFFSSVGVMIDIHVEVAGIPIDSEKSSFLKSTKYLKGGPWDKVDLPEFPTFHGDIKGHVHDFAGLYNKFLLMAVFIIIHHLFSTK